MDPILTVVAFCQPVSVLDTQFRKVSFATSELPPRFNLVHHTEYYRDRILGHQGRKVSQS